MIGVAGKVSFFLLEIKVIVSPTTKVISILVAKDGSQLLNEWCGTELQRE